jgi:hypothetical protein
VKAPEILRHYLLVKQVIELLSSVAFIVTVMPELIVTDSVAVGTAAPPQVAVSFQLPVTLAMRWANKSVPAKRNKNTSNAIFEIAPEFLHSRNCFSCIEIHLQDKALI